jgi:serine/threonine-protein kinase
VKLAGRYRLDERIGVGGMGEVWRATDEVLGRLVAVKLMLADLAHDPEFHRRFHREARAMASVSHRHVAAVHDFGVDRAGAFLVMEFVPGEPLARTLARQGRLGPATTTRLVAEVADALHAVHGQGIVHRDVKPANLMVRPDGAVVLTDFGIVRDAAASAMTQSGAVLGTPSYLAPEQVLGQPATPRSDIYALGVVAYECLAGRRPFQGDNPYAVANQRLQERPPPLTGDPGVVAVVERALATHPAQRWPDAATFAAAARQAGAALPPDAEARTLRPPAAPAPSAPAGRADPYGRPEPAPAPDRGRNGRTDRPGGRRRARLVLAVVGLLALAGAAAWLVQRLDTGGGTGDPAAGGPTGGPGGGARPGSPPSGFVACDGLYCPAQPQCWGGLVFTSGRLARPRSLDCGEPHSWETFAVAPLEPAAAALRTDELMDQRPEVAEACSATVMTARSVDPEATRGWRQQPMPVPTGPDTWLVYCLAAPQSGELTGPRFTAGG